MSVSLELSEVSVPYPDGLLSVSDSLSAAAMFQFDTNKNVEGNIEQVSYYYSNYTLIVLKLRVAVAYVNNLTRY